MLTVMTWHLRLAWPLFKTNSSICLYLILQKKNKTELEESITKFGCISDGPTHRLTGGRGLLFWITANINVRKQKQKLGDRVATSV